MLNKGKMEVYGINIGKYVAKRLGKKERNIVCENKKIQNRSSGINQYGDDEDIFTEKKDRISTGESIGQTFFLLDSIIKCSML